MDISSKAYYDVIIHISREEIIDVLNELEQDNLVMETVDMGKNQYRLYNMVIGSLLDIDEKQ